MGKCINASGGIDAPDFDTSENVKNCGYNRRLQCLGLYKPYV